MKKVILALVAFFPILIGCVRTQTNQIAEASEDNGSKSENTDMLCSIIDSLFRVYPKAMDNPIQKADFIKALGTSVKGLSIEDKNMIVEHIPFKLYRVQNVPNQPGGKYLVAFEYSKKCTDFYSIKVYGFAALDKDVASDLEERMEYRLSGDVEFLREPSLGGWSDNEITFGVDIKNASITRMYTNGYWSKR